MFFWDLITQSKIALKKESESEICYVYGKGFTNINTETKTFFKSKSIFKGFFFRSLIFFFLLFKNFSLFSKKITSNTIYIYVGSRNAFESVKPIVDTLLKKKKNFHLEINENIPLQVVKYLPKSKYSFFVINLKIVLAASFLFILNGFKLYFKLKKKIVISYYYNRFCDVYLYLTYFFEKLSKIKPKLVIVCNDHSVEDRALRLVAETLKIKTLYIQHASVTQFFPPLEFNYALLDGLHAHQTYLNCYYRQTKKYNRIENNIKKCCVFLSGQKKKFKIKKKYFVKKNITLGIATGTLASFNYVKSALNNISKLGLNCIIRFHPDQPASFIRQVEDYSKNINKLKLFYSQKSTLSDFFSKVDAVISFNSSIILEAAIVGLPTFYMKMYQTSFKSDFYGFAKTRLAFKLNKNFNISQLIILMQKAKNFKRKKIIKNFSETHGTIWQNKEHNLVYKIIESIIEKKNIPVKFFKELDSKIYNKVFKLKYK
jgi:hypothetical protein